MRTQFLKFHGGKFYLRKKILYLLPKRRLYVEPFLGGGAVLQEVRGPKVGADVDADLINLWRHLRDSDEFFRAVQGQAYSESAWEFWTTWETENPIELAMKRLIRQRFSRGGLGTAFAWSERLRGGKPGDVNAWENFKKALPLIRDSIREVNLYVQGFEETITCYNYQPGVCFYCDPPYPHGTRVSTSAYRFEMSDEDHRRFLSLITSSPGSFVVSSYPNPLYLEALRDWKCYKFDLPNNAGQGEEKERRVECLWVKKGV